MRYCTEPRERVEACLACDRGVCVYELDWTADCPRMAPRKNRDGRPRGHGGGRPPLLLSYRGETMSAADWARKLGVDGNALRTWYHRNGGNGEATIEFYLTGRGRRT